MFLISLLLSLYRGWDEKVGGFVEDAGIDIWIAREGTTDFLSAASILPLDSGNLLAVRQDIERWSPLIVRPMKASKTNGGDFDISLVGYKLDTDMGGPIEIDAGAEEPGQGQVIIDESLADRYGLDIGDKLVMVGQELEIAGISSGGNFVFSATVFVSYEQAESLLEQPGFTTFFLLDLKDPGQGRETAASIQENYPGTLAITGDDFAEATRQQIMGEVLPILSVILVLAFVVGLAVAGLTIYTATVEKAREYGILKAVGFRNSYLYRLVFEQSLVTGFLGFTFGIGLTLLIGPFASDLVPQFVLLTRWFDVAGVFLATLLMAAIAGYIPVRRLAGIDPTTVFKA